MAEHELVIRNGTVVDGTGAERAIGDVAVSGGVITEVGSVSGSGTREIDAEGHLVTPGFVDIHTHTTGRRHGIQHSLRQAGTESPPLSWATVVLALLQCMSTIVSVSSS